MSRDLEEQLDEMGPEYRVVALRLRAAREAAQGNGDQGSGGGWSLPRFSPSSVSASSLQPRNLVTSQPRDIPTALLNIGHLFPR